MIHRPSMMWETASHDERELIPCVASFQTPPSVEQRNQLGRRLLAFGRSHDVSDEEAVDIVFHGLPVVVDDLHPVVAQPGRALLRMKQMEDIERR
ncbi:putative neuromedin-U isoform X3 [Sesbania bispinosa]|nr:putative neuromedin-U isoform X3 [Sesbania bispinosa]